MLNKLFKAFIAISFISITSSAYATSVSISNAPTGSNISPFGVPQSETYGQVFTAPVTGILTSFTFSLNDGVGAVYGGVDGWNGSAAFDFGFGSSGNLFTSGSVASSGAQSYTFNANINVVAGQLYVAYLSVFGDPGATTTTSMPLGDSSSPYLNYFVWNNNSAPQNNASWNYFFNAGNALFSANFTATVPEPDTYAALLAGLTVITGISRRQKRK